MDAEAKKIRKWADSGDRIDPEHLGSAIDRGDGYGPEYSSNDPADRLFPSRQLENQLLREITGWIYDAIRDGIPAWDPEINYRLRATVKHNRDLYLATEATGPATGNAITPGLGIVWEQVNGRITDPGQVTGLTATAVSTALDLSWDTPLDGGALITNYRVRRRVVGASAWVEVTTTDETPSWRLDNLTNGERFDVQVRAENADGRLGEWSATVRATPNATVPAAITCFVVNHGTRVVWVSLDPPDDGGSAITGYDYQWKADGEDWSATRQRTLGAGFFFGAVSDGITIGERITVRARARNSVGAGEWSVERSRTPETGIWQSWTPGSYTYQWPWGGGGTAAIVARGASGGAQEDSVVTVTQTLHGTTTLTASGGSVGEQRTTTVVDVAIGDTFSITVGNGHDQHGFVGIYAIR